MVWDLTATTEKPGGYFFVSYTTTEQQQQQQLNWGLWKPSLSSVEWNQIHGWLIFPGYCMEKLLARKIVFPWKTGDDKVANFNCFGFVFLFFFSSISDWLNHLSSSVISCNWFRKRLLSETRWLARKNEKDLQYVIYFSNWLKNKESKNVKANTNKYLIVGGFFFCFNSQNDFFLRLWSYTENLQQHTSPEKSRSSHETERLNFVVRNHKA